MSTWKPQIGQSWQYQLSGDIDVNAQAMIMNIQSDSAATVAAIKAVNPARKVICYVNVGSLDKNISDESQFLPSDLGNPYDRWPEETFLDTRSTNVRRIMAARISAKRDMGCDGIDPDNMAFGAETGFNLTVRDQADYVWWFSGVARKLGLKVGGKNGAALYEAAPELVAMLDWVVVEECARNGNCAEYDVFVKAGKPVYAVEYLDAGISRGCDALTGTVQSACNELNAHNFDGIVKSCDLNSTVTFCRDATQSMPSKSFAQGKASCMFTSFSFFVLLSIVL